MKQTDALHNLQTVESEIDSVHKRLKELAILLGRNKDVLDAQASLSESEQSYQEWHRRQTDVDLERSHLQQEAKATEERLYSGLVFNPRELGDLQDKLAELKRRYELLEEPALEAMFAIDTATETIKSRRAELEHVLEKRAHESGEFGNEQASLSAQLEVLNNRAAEARATIDSKHLALYDRLRHKPGGIVVAAIHDRECGGCGVELTSVDVQNVRHDEIITCPTCGRILYI